MSFTACSSRPFLSPGPELETSPELALARRRSRSVVQSLAGRSADRRQVRSPPQQFARSRAGSQPAARLVPISCQCPELSLARSVDHAWTYAYRWRTRSGEPIDGGGGRPAEERSVLALRRGSRGGLRAIYGRARGQDGQANRPASSAAVDHAQAFGGSSQAATSAAGFAARSRTRTPLHLRP